MSRYVFCLLLLLLPCLRMQAQLAVPASGYRRQGPIQSGDTMKVDLLLRSASGYYDKMTLRGDKRDSAFALIARAKKYCVDLNYKKGLVAALRLEANVYHKWRLAWLAKGENEVLEQTIDSFEKEAIKTIDQYKDLTIKANLLMALADAYDWRLEGSDDDRKVNYYKAAAELYRQRGHTKHEGLALLQQGITLYHSGVIPLADTILNKAVKILIAQGYTRLQLAYGSLCYVYIAQGDFRLGTEYGLKGVRLAEQFRDSSAEVSEVYKNLGYCYEMMKDRPAAISYFGKSLAIAQKHGVVHEIYSSGGQIGKLLVKDSPDSAISLLRGILRQYPVHANNHINVEVYIHLLNAHLRKKQFKEAAFYVSRLQFFASQMEELSLSRSYVLSVLVDFYIATGQYEKAAKELAVCKVIETQNGQVPALSSIYRRMYKIDSALGDFKSSLKHYRLWKSIVDSVESTEQKNQVAELRLAFETEQQQKDITLLQRENRLKSERINRSALERNVVIGFTVLLLVIFCLLFYQFHQKKVANRQIKAKNSLLEKLLQEKEWLLKEVHHRVKNNLQTVVSLLESQASKLKDDALDAIHESQHRVFAISLIHKKLYQAENIRTVDMTVYIPELIDYIKEMNNNTRAITFRFNIEDIQLDVSQAVPVGLIINEAVTNAMKYAFAGRNYSPGCIISISMQHTGNNQLRIIIADNGAGLDDTVLASKTEGLGFRLMSGLAEDLDGTLIFANENGALLTIVFPYNQDFLSAA